MRKTKKPLIGGILSILSGLTGLLGIFSYTYGFGEAGSGLGRGDMPPFVPSIIYGLPVPAVLIALGAVAGGIFTLSRKRWGWSLAGAIAALLSFIILGIPAVVLTVLSRDEFK